MELEKVGKLYEDEDIQSFGTRSEPEYDAAGVWQKFNREAFIKTKGGDKITIPIAEVDVLRKKFRGRLMVEKSLTIDYDKRHRERRNTDFHYIVE